jgi:segregation and condensation protein B
MNDNPADFEHLRLIEALLFASATPLTEAAIAARLPEGVDTRGLLKRLQEFYAGRGVNIVAAGNAWAFRTAPELGAALSLETTSVKKLSRAAVETLAIIAYHQPVSRAEIEEVRGVALSKGTMDILFEAGWIAPKGRKRTPGRPIAWGTTQAFLDHFALGGLDELPGVEELKAAGLLDTRPAMAAYGSRAHDDGTLFDIAEREEDNREGEEVS